MMWMGLAWLEESDRPRKSVTPDIGEEADRFNAKKWPLWSAAACRRFFAGVQRPCESKAVTSCRTPRGPARRRKLNNIVATRQVTTGFYREQE
jgi:hypothetical protein